jgi:hypothetical protein
MNPHIPEILTTVIELAEKSLDKPSGELRRLDKIEQLFVRVHAAAEAPTDQRRRFVNEWTLQLMMMLRKVERLDDTLEQARAATVGLAILQFVKRDLADAMIAAIASTSDHDFKKPVRGGA